MNSPVPNLNPYQVLCLGQNHFPAEYCISHNIPKNDLNRWFINHIDHVTANKSDKVAAVGHINEMKEYLYKNHHTEVCKRLDILLKRYGSKKPLVTATCCDAFERAAERFSVSTDDLSKDIQPRSLEDKEYMWKLSIRLEYEEVSEKLRACKSNDDKWREVKVKISHFYLLHSY